MVRTLFLVLTGVVLAAAPAAAQAQVVRVPARAGSEDPVELAAFAKLDTMKVSLDFEDTPIVEVIRFLRQTSGLNLVLDGEVKRDGGLEDKRLSLQVTDVTLRGALSLAMEFSGLCVRWRHGVFIVTTPEKARGKPMLRLYDVRDLTFKLTDFPGPSMALKSGNDTSSEGISFGNEEKNPPPTTDEIVNTIKESIGEGLEANGAGLTIIGGLLLVRAEPEIHEEIRALLSMLRASR